MIDIKNAPMWDDEEGLRTDPTPGSFEWRRAQREDAISTLMQMEGDEIMAELGRHPDADGQWSDEDIAALYAECQRRIPEIIA